MIHFSRLGTLTLLTGGMLSIPSSPAAGMVLHSTANSGQTLVSNSSQGYLGVVIRDVDNDRAAGLKLKDPHGAEIVSIDQDAPASKAGLRVRDVVVQMNGQRIEGVEQFRRMLHETPAGRNVALVVMREGQSVNVTAQLGDHAAIVTQIFGGLDDPDGLPSPGAADSAPGNATAAGPKKPSRSYYGFLDPFSRNRYYVGVEVERLPTGLADYFGARNGSGLLVGNVFPNSPAAVAGLKPADVIEKVNGRPVVSLSDWEKAIRLNHGKPIQITVIRDKQERTLTMVAGGSRSKTSSELILPQPPTARPVSEPMN